MGLRDALRVLDRYRGRHVADGWNAAKVMMNKLGVLDVRSVSKHLYGCRQISALIIHIRALPLGMQALNLMLFVLKHFARVLTPKYSAAAR